MKGCIQYVYLQVGFGSYVCQEMTHIIFQSSITLKACWQYKGFCLHCTYHVPVIEEYVIYSKIQKVDTISQNILKYIGSQFLILVVLLAAQWCSG